MDTPQRMFRKWILPRLTTPHKSCAPGGRARPSLRERLVLDGKPVANSEIGLASHSRLSGTTFSEVLIGPKEDGTFTIAIEALTAVSNPMQFRPHLSNSDHLRPSAGNRAKHSTPAKAPAKIFFKVLVHPEPDNPAKYLLPITHS